MFRLNQAALLSSQLIVVCQVFAGIVDCTDIHVSRGDSVTLTCNTSTDDATQITWTNGRSVFAYAAFKKLNASNFTSDRVKIDLNSPLKLNVSNAQQDDAGLYTCTVTAGGSNTRTTEWNLIVSEEVSPGSKETTPMWYFLYILTSIVGFHLCGIAAAVCICRKGWTENLNLNQDLVRSRTLSYVQFHVQLGRGEVVPPQPQTCVKYRIKHKQQDSSVHSLV